MSEDDVTDDDGMDKEEIAEEVWYICYPCMANSPGRQNKVHWSVTSEVLLICDDCSSPFQVGYKVTNKDLYICEECLENFDSYTELTSHSCEQSDAWPYVCKTCGKGFAFRTRLLHHETKHSEESLTNESFDKSSPSVEDESCLTSEDI